MSKPTSDVTIIEINIELERFF